VFIFAYFISNVSDFRRSMSSRCLSVWSVCLFVRVDFVWAARSTTSAVLRTTAAAAGADRSHRQTEQHTRAERRTLRRHDDNCPAFTENSTTSLLFSIAAASSRGSNPLIGDTNWDKRAEHRCHETRPHPSCCSLACHPRRSVARWRASAVVRWFDRSRLRAAAARATSRSVHCIRQESHAAVPSPHKYLPPCPHSRRHAPFKRPRPPNLLPCCNPLRPVRSHHRRMDDSGRPTATKRHNRRPPWHTRDAPFPR
jgi:hypothetical protein